MDYVFGAIRAVSHMPLGLRANVTYGANNVLGVFIGVDVKADFATSDGIAGRFSLVRTW